ncbi:MAG: beta-lactamase family protein [Bacteroidales bacterium]|nr:beta-lactamase family protein [Bacteroidales bacterium]
MKQKLFPFLTIILMSTMSLLHAQESNQLINSKLIEEYKTLIREKMQTGHLVGVGAALILGDSVWKEGFGFADKENKIPFTTQTALNIGSITKPFTGMGVMQLQEKKLLDVDKPLVEYLPEFSIKTRKSNINDITVKSVIQHTSGIPNNMIKNFWAVNENYTNTVSYLKGEYLAYPVNFIYHYSNPGYALLGHTILKVSKQDYPLYIQNNILKPIGMNNSGFLGYTTLNNLSKTYDSTGTYYPVKYGRGMPAGDLISTIDDMVKFALEMIAIYHGKKGGFIRPETLKLFDEINNDNIENRNTCMGWDVFKNDSSLVIMHGGSHFVAIASLTIDLKKKIAAIFLVNTVGGMDLTGEATDKFWELSGIKSANLIHSYPYKNHTSDNIFIDSLKLHTGIYVNTSEIHDVKFENDKLLLNSPYGNFELKPQTNDEFLPGTIKADTVRWMKKPRFVFYEVMGYKLLVWQDAGYKRQPLGILETPKEINETWRARLGKYKLVDNNIEQWNKILEMELSIADNNLLQLKKVYSEGEYINYMLIENDNELITCGFGETGGETISFGKENQKDIMKLDGLTMRKID